MAREAGISDKQLRHRDVARLSRDTYAPAVLVGSLRTRLPAVLLTAPPGAVVSHATAAALWGVEIPLQPQPDLRADLTVPLGSRAESRADRRIHRSECLPDDVTRRASLPVTTPARTWRDLAGVLRPPALLAVTDQLLDGVCTRAELERQLTRRPRGRGCARARAVLPMGDRRSESPMESVLRWLIHEGGLQMPDLQVDLYSDDGSFVGRADFLWRDRRVLVEFDGDHHRERSTFVKDLRRQNGLVEAGWTVLRFSSADVLGRPAYVIATIRRALR